MSKKHFFFPILFCILWCVWTGASAETVRGDLEARFSTIPRIEQDGTTYRFRSRMTTILLLGIDQQGTMEEPGLLLRHRNGGQADFLLLLAIDDNAKTIAPIYINRDTMAQVTVLNVLGQVAGTREMQLCLSHGFGDGKEQSCELTMDAVSHLLLNTAIDHYAALEMSGISVLNDLLGGVTVTLEDDLTNLDPALKKGETVTLKGAQAEYFVRGRYGVADGSNLNRSGRQRTYISALEKLLREKISVSPNYIGTLFDQMESFLVTDMSRGYLINLANKADRYTTLPITQFTGEHKISQEGYNEFYPDAQSVLNVVLEAFYSPEE
ncbi:MAG: LytR family transcriptional regulator [Clostridiales bacterium]|nr:LytR family transcriptional regulator [Clostridiales bacterium]